MALKQLRGDVPATNTTGFNFSNICVDIYNYYPVLIFLISLIQKGIFILIIIDDLLSYDVSIIFFPIMWS
jgi:hypothetical protein